MHERDSINDKRDSSIGIREYLDCGDSVPKSLLRILGFYRYSRSHSNHKNALSFRIRIEKADEEKKIRLYD